MNALTNNIRISHYEVEYLLNIDIETIRNYNRIELLSILGIAEEDEVLHPSIGWDKVSDFTDIELRIALLQHIEYLRREEAKKLNIQHRIAAEVERYDELKKWLKK